MKFSIKDFFSKCDKFGNFLWIWSHLLKESLMENFNFFVLLGKQTKTHTKIQNCFLHPNSLHSSSRALMSQSLELMKLKSINAAMIKAAKTRIPQKIACAHNWNETIEKFSPALFEIIPPFVCLVFKIKNKWILKLQILFSWKTGWFKNKLYQAVTFCIMITYNMLTQKYYFC